jgi:CheY-like chemotaxis protein
MQTHDERHPERAIRRGKHLRVLVVEDMAIVAEMLITLLELWGHEVQAVKDGPTALVVARTFQPDVVLLDLGLPGMSGFDVARQLRQEAQRKLFLAAVTGYGDEGVRRRSQEAGFDHHMTKPIDPDDLQALLAVAEAHR